MSKINLYLRAEGKDKTEGYIWVKFYVSSQKVNFSTRVKVLAANWNAVTCRIKYSDKEYKDKNLIITNTEARINDVFVKYRLKNRKLTKDGFMKAYHRPDDFDTFHEFCEFYKKEISYLEAGTTGNHKKALDKLKDYEPNLTFDELDYDFLLRFFNAHLLKTCENKHSTAYKDMASIKKFVRAAIRKGYMEKNPFDDFKIKRVQGDFEFLTEEELNKMLKLYYSGKLPPEQHKTLQLFMYMCFSSQHITDSLKTRLEDFTPDGLVYYRIKNRNSKPEKVLVTISDMLRSIVTDIVGYRKTGLIFMDMPAEQTMNKYLKAIAKREDVGINKNLSTKAGRHTFATFYLSKTKDMNSLQEEMGHSDIRETLKYAHVLDSDKKENIKMFDAFLKIKDETNL
jgi:integrase/recombinase XerD